MVVTGATGFVGRAYVEYCLERSSLPIRILARQAGAAERLWPGRNIQVHVGDLARSETLAGLVGPGDILVHLAYLKADPDANRAAVRALIGTVTAAPAARVVHCSTAVVVGPRARGRVDESTPTAPDGDYQVTKLDLERLWLSAAGVEVGILRPTEVVGPGGQGLLSLIERVAVGPAWRRDLYRRLLGARRCHYVSVRNVAGALWTLATSQHPSASGVFQVSDDADPDNRYAALDDLVRAGVELPPGRAPLVPAWLVDWALRRTAGHEPADRLYTQDRLLQLGYRPEVTLRDTIKGLLAARPPVSP